MMIEATSKRRGAWGLYVFPPTSVLPAFAQWIHDAAAGWVAEFMRVMFDARAAGIMRDGGPLDAQRAAMAAATRALGMAARAMDTPIPTFAVYAVPFRKAENGPDFWVNLWADPMPVGSPRPSTTTAREAIDQGPDDPRNVYTWGTFGGTWRPEVIRLVQGNSTTVRDAVNVLLDLHLGYWLTVDGLPLVRELAEAPDPTFNGEVLSRDAHAWACPSAGSLDVWRCVAWSVATPPFGAASSDVYLSAVVPVAWQWQLFERVEQNIARLGSVDGIVTASREYCAALNLAAALAAGVAVPERVVQQAAQEQQRRFQPTREDELLTSAAEAGVQSGNPVGVFIGGALLGLQALQDAVGRALQYAVDPWGQREPRVAKPFLSGEVSGNYYVAPSISIPAAPPGVPYPTGAGAWGGREVRTDELGEPGAPGGAGGRPAVMAPTEGAAGGGGVGEVAGWGVGLYLLAKLLGGV